MSSVAMLSVMAAASLSSFEPVTAFPLPSGLFDFFESDLAKATTATKTARTEYVAARKAWEDRLKADEATLLKDDAFPKPFAEDPLKAKREALSKAKDALTQLLPKPAGTTAAGTAPTGTAAGAAAAPAQDPQEILTATTEVTDAGNALKDEAADKKLVVDATTALAKAIKQAITTAVGTKDKAEDEESEAAIVRILAASSSALGKLNALEPRREALPPYKEPAPGATDGPPNVASIMTEAKKTLKEDRGKQVIDLAEKTKGQLSTLEKDQRTYLEKQADGPAAGRRNISARRRAAFTRDATAAMNKIDDALKSDDMSAAAKSLDVQVQALLSTVALVDDDLSGGSDTWVQKAIPVYYFGSIPRLITALNLDASQFQSDFFRDLDDAEAARKALLDNEDARDLKRAERNNLIATLAQMRTQIRASKAKRSLDLARLDTLKGQKANLESAIKAEQAEKNPNATKISQLQKKLDDVTADVTSGETKDEAGKDDIDRQQAAIEALEAKVPAVEKQLEVVVSEVNKLRVANARLAATEVSAFRKTEIHRPFWYARPYKGSNDPSKRCAIFGYDDAQVLFVRGEEKDVDHVLEAVAAFDRPTPQARVTLHTLQFNGSDANRLSQATHDVEQTLNGLRGNLTLVQDALRNAISKEVNRSSRVAQLALWNGTQSPDFSERVYRGFYFPREIREALGLRARTEDVSITGKTTVNARNLRYRLAAAIDDLEQAQASFILALKRYHTAEQLNASHSALDSAMVEVENALIAVGYSFGRFAEYGMDAYGLPGTTSPNFSFTSALTPANAWQILLWGGDQLTSVIRADVSFHNLYDLLHPMLGHEENGQHDRYEIILKATDVLLKDMKDDLNNLKNGGLQANGALQDPEFLKSTEYVTLYTLPDPARGTTLGELLFVFSLGGQDSRARILRDFSSELLNDVRVATSGRSRRKMRNDATVAQEWLAKGTDGSEPGNGLSKDIASIYAFASDAARLYGNPVETTVPKGSNSLFPYFPRTVFGGFSPRAHPGPSEEPMTANQLEILTAIQARVKIGVLAQAYSLVPATDQALDVDAQEKLKWLTGYIRGNYRETPAVAGSPGVSKSFSEFAPQKIKNAQNPTDAVRALNVLRTEVGPEESMGRAAAADDMIKRFVTVLEDDLQHYLVAPALETARAAVNGRGSRFANYQSTSILATNRNVARYDASAVATLGQDPNAGADAAMAAQQLSDIVSGMQGGDEARRAGGVAPFIGPALLYNRDPKARGDKFLAQGALGLLVSSLLIPDETAKGDLYSLTSGGEFKLTPIIDPSGQAFSFLFDYSLSTRILDPLGGQGVELPRVERQSFNTQIQITNLEFRRVAEFSSNTRIGVPERRSGGFPVLKELPVFKDIPLLGYFVRSRGTDAVRQQTYVFAQTSLYPTVSDIVNLLVASPLRTLPTTRQDVK